MYGHICYVMSGGTVIVVAKVMFACYYLISADCERLFNDDWVNAVSSRQNKLSVKNSSPTLDIVSSSQNQGHLMWDGIRSRFSTSLNFCCAYKINF